MSIAIAETFSKVDDFDISEKTYRMKAEDWVLPVPEMVRSGDETAIVEANGRDCSSNEKNTVQSARFSIAKPLRRDDLTVRIKDYCIRLLQQWECVIVEVYEDRIACEMHDLTDEAQPTEYAEVFVDEFSDFDKPLLQEGAVFYWSIGHFRRNTGQVRRYSDLRIRRMPPPSASQMLAIKRKAEKLSELFRENGCR